MSTLKDTTAATSTGVISLVGGPMTFAAMLAIGSTIPEVRVLDYFGNWEIGTYTLTDPKTLTRQSIRASSNGGQPVAFPPGIKEVVASVAESAVLQAPHLNTGTSATPSGLVDALGNPFGYVPPISQFERALILPQIRQSNAVKGLSRNINDAQFVGAVTDADVYDCEPGALTVGMSYNGGTPTALGTKGLAFPWGKTLWDANNGESLFLQMRVKAVGATTSSQILCGNLTSALGWEGFNVQYYGPSHASLPGRLFFNFRGAGSAAQAIEITPLLVAAGSVARAPLATDTYYNISVIADGATKKVDAWVNCQPGLSNSSGANQTMNSGSSVPAVKRNLGLGYGAADDSFAGTGIASARFQAFRMAVLPANLRVLNPGLLDLKFNINPYQLFTDADYVGAI